MYSLDEIIKLRTKLLFKNHPDQNSGKQGSTTIEDIQKSFNILKEHKQIKQVTEKERRHMHRS